MPWNTFIHNMFVQSDRLIQWGRGWGTQNPISTLIHTGVTVRPQATNCTLCHYSLPLLQSQAPLQQWRRARNKMWTEFLRRRRGRKQIQTDGWKEHRRCGWTDSSLRSKRGHNAEDFGVWLRHLWRHFFAYQWNGKKAHAQKSSIMLHAPSVTQYLHVFSGCMLSLGWLFPHFLQMQQWPSFCGGIIKDSCEYIVQGLKR